MSAASMISTKRIVVGEDDEGAEIAFVVRGLSLADISAVMRDDGGVALAAVYQQARSSGFGPETVATMAGDLLESIPELVARIIARAAGTPDNWEELTDVSVGHSLDLIDAIVGLTFTSDRVVKKAWEVVRRYAKEGRAPHRSASKIGSGD